MTSGVQELSIILFRECLGSTSVPFGCVQKKKEEQGKVKI